MSLLSKILKTISTAVVVATFSYSTVISAAPVPGGVIEGGELVGLTNINVAGFGLYNVSFHTHYQGNAYGNEFVFAAGLAALNLGTGSGLFQGTLFDYRPELTRGCGNPSTGPSVIGGSASEVCAWAIVANEEISNGLPVVDGGIFINHKEVNDNLDTAIFFPFVSPVDFEDVTYTNWTKVSEVPVPAAFFLFAPALLGLLGLRRKNKA